MSERTRLGRENETPVPVQDWARDPKATRLEIINGALEDCRAMELGPTRARVAAWVEGYLSVWESIRSTSGPPPVALPSPSDRSTFEILGDVQAINSLVAAKESAPDAIPSPSALNATPSAEPVVRESIRWVQAFQRGETVTDIDLLDPFVREEVEAIQDLLDSARGSETHAKVTSDWMAPDADAVLKMRGLPMMTETGVGGPDPRIAERSKTCAWCSKGFRLNATGTHHPTKCIECGVTWMETVKCCAAIPSPSETPK